MNPIRYVVDGYRWLVDPYRFLDEAMANHGLTFRVRLPVLGSVLMTGDEGLIAEIARHKDLDGGQPVTALRAILGSRSLIMLEGEAHAARRRLIVPSFSGEGLAAYDELIVGLTHEVFRELPAERSFSIYDVLRRQNLRTIVAAMFGTDNPVLPEAEAIVERFLNSFQNPLILFCRPLRLDAGPWSPWGRALRNREALCDLIRSQIKSPQGETILARLAAETALSEDELIEEVISLLLFGHDTAAATMAWAFVHIYRDPALVERVRDEVASDWLPDADGLPFLKACLQESMRLCPVVVHLARTATADLRIGDFEIRRGQQVIPCTYIAQHNPATFPEPHAFRPERFLGGERYEHRFFPFGFGSRTCPGRPFAMRQMLLVLATAVRTADLELASADQGRPARHLVLIVPRNGGLLLRRHSKAITPVACG